MLKRIKRRIVRTKRRLGAPLATRGFYPFRGGSRELKFFDVAVGTTQVNTTGSITLIFAPQLGSDYNARIGRKTTIKSFYVRGRLVHELGSGGNPQQGRMMLIVDNQPNGTLPAITDILSSADPAAHLNPNNRDRFRVLCDKQYVFGSANVTTPAIAGVNIKNIKLYKKMSLNTIFNSSNTGTITDITSGALLLVWIGSLPSGTNDLNAIISTRVRYSD